MKTNYEAVILDLDGTTVASREAAMPSQRVIKAVQAAQKLAHVSVATGRPYDYALPIVRALGLHGPSVFNGGAEIVEAHSGNVIQKQYLSQAAMKELVTLSLPFGYNVYTDDDKYSTPITSPDQVINGAAKLFIESIKASDAIHLLEELAAVTTASAHTTTSWQEGDVLDVHVTHVNGTKRHGVEKLITLLGTNKELTLAIGDSYNDIPLLEAVGFKVAMGNAPEEVKSIADYVAPSLEDDGVAVTLERFILS